MTIFLNVRLDFFLKWKMLSPLSPVNRVVCIFLSQLEK